KFVERSLAQKIEVEFQVGFLRPPSQKRLISEFAQLGAQGLRGGKVANGRDQFFVCAVNEPAAAVVNDFRQRAEIADDNGCFASECFDDDDAEGFVGEGWYKTSQRMRVEPAQFALWQRA